MCSWKKIKFLPSEEDSQCKRNLWFRVHLSLLSSCHCSDLLSRDTITASILYECVIAHFHEKFSRSLDEQLQFENSVVSSFKDFNADGTILSGEYYWAFSEKYQKFRKLLQWMDFNMWGVNVGSFSCQVQCWGQCTNQLTWKIME